MLKKSTAPDGLAPEVADAGAEVQPVSVTMPTPAESFLVWWNATIPDSKVSRNTAVYNKAHALRNQLYSVLSEV